MFKGKIALLILFKKRNQQIQVFKKKKPEQRLAQSRL